MPALPQQISCSANGSDLDAGNRPQQIARRLADALRVRQVAGVVVRDAQPRSDAAAPAARRAPTTHLGDVAHARRERARALGPRRIVGEQLAVLLHRRSAAGGVDGDPLDAGALEASIVRRANARASSSRPACSASAPQQPWSARRDHVAAFGGQHVDGRVVHVRKDEPLHAAGQQADRQPRARRRPASARAPTRTATPTSPSARATASRERATDVRARQRGSSAESVVRGSSVAATRARPQRRSRAAPARARSRPRIREQREDGRAEQPIAERSRDSGARSARGSPR